MNKIKKSTLLLLLASSLLLSGCDVISVQEYDKLENISADFGAVDSSTVFTGGESTNIQASEPVETNIISVEPQVTTALKSETENQNSESYLPPNMSMDDLLNMIQIDGKTLSMPTTLENILALNNDFTYEMAFSDLYASPEDSIKDMGGVFYDINCKGEKIFQVVIAKDDYTGNYMNSLIYKFSNGFGKNMIESNIDFKLVNQIDLNSISDDVIIVFGAPNDSSNNSPHDLCYLFSNEDIQYKLRFCFNVDKNTDTFNELKSIQISCERK